METHGNPIFIYILIGAFLAVGVHLIIYTRKRRNMLIRFARKRGLRHQLEDSGELEAELNKKLAFEEPGMARAFMKLKDIVTDGPIHLFRCIELLDLSRSGSAMSGHTNRICTMFIVPDRINFITIVNKDGTVHHRYPKDKKIEEDPDFLKLLPIVKQNLPHRSITVSFKDGCALFYINPLVVGGEKQADLDYLLSISKNIRSVLV